MLLHLKTLQKHNRFNSSLIWKLRFQLLKRPVYSSCKSEFGNFNVSYINYNTQSIISISESKSVQTEVQEVFKNLLTNTDNLHSVLERDTITMENKADISKNTNQFNRLSETELQQCNFSLYSSIKHIRCQRIEWFQVSTESRSSQNIRENSSPICYSKEQQVIHKYSKQEFASHNSCIEQNVLHGINFQSSELYMIIMEAVKNINKNDDKHNCSESSTEVESVTLSNVSQKKDKNIIQDYNCEQNCKKKIRDPRLEVRVKIPELALNLPKCTLKSEYAVEVVDEWFDDFLERFKHKLNLSEYAKQK